MLNVRNFYWNKRMEDSIQRSNTNTNEESKHGDVSEPTNNVQKDESNVIHVNSVPHADYAGGNERTPSDGPELATSKLEELSKPSPNVKTLADLISVCRNRGLQIFNDKQNIPESDTLKVLPAYLTDTKVHRSDGLDARRRDSVASGRRSRRPSSFRQPDSIEENGRIRSSHSQWTTRSFKSGSESRFKSSPCSTPSRGHSVYSSHTDLSYGRQTLHEKVSLDFPDFEGDLEAERVLQLRMRRKSKRHRDSTAHLSDVIKMKQRELEHLRNKLNSTKEGDRGHPSDDGNGEVIHNAKSEISVRENDAELDKEPTFNQNGNITHNAKSEIGVTATAELDKEPMLSQNDSKGVSDDTEAKCIDSPNRVNGHNESKTIENQNYSSKHVGNHSVNESADNIKNERNDPNNAQETESGDTSHGSQSGHTGEQPNPDNGIDTEIQEYVIQDGNTKLVLYKLKTNTSLLESLDKGEINDSNMSKKSEVSTDSSTGHIDSQLKHLETPSSTNVSRRSPENIKTSIDINNSTPYDEIAGDEAYTNKEETLNPQSLTHSNDDIRKTNIKSGDADKIDETLTDRPLLTPQENKLQDSENGHSVTLEVNQTYCDSNSQLNVNKVNINCNNETDIKDVFDHKNCSNLETVNNQESVSQKQVPEDLPTTNSNLEVSTDSNNTMGKHNSVQPHDGNNTKLGINDNVSEERKTIQDNENISHGGQMGNGHIQSNGGVNNSIPKRPKRSLGNGFLVSADDAEDNDDNGKNATKGNSDIKLENGDNVSASTLDTVSSSSKTGKDKDIQQQSTSRSQSKASSSRSKKKFTSLAKQVFVASKIKQSFDEANTQQTKYVEELGDTRKALWEILRRMKAGEDDPKEDKGMDTAELEESLKKDERVDNEIEHRETPVEHTGDVSKDPEEKPDTESEIVESDTTNVNTNGEDVDKIEVVSREEETPSEPSHVDHSDDTMSQSTARSKPIGVKKIDNQWDPNHPLYEQIKGGFKSNFRRHETKHVNHALKGLRVDKFDTTQVSSNNVYVVEAKRIYPKGFPESENQTKKTNNHPKDNLNSDTMARYDPNRLDRETTLYRAKDAPMNHENKVHIDYKVRNNKRVKRLDNNTEPVKQETSTPRKTIIPRPKPKLRSNKVDIEDGKLTKDRDNIKYYQEYINNSSEIPTRKTSQKKKKNPPANNRDRPKRDPNNVHRANFTSYSDTRDFSYDDDDDDVPLDEMEPETMATRETANEKLARYSSARSLGSERHSEDVPLSKAVEIVQSRNKFYDNDQGVIKTNQREHRVFKLFREIQMIRRKGDHSIDPSTHIGYPDVEMNTSGFLMMDYDFSRSTISSHKTDTELQKFLYNSIDYEMNVRSRSLHAFPRRRDKALIELKQKLEHPLVYSSNLK